MMIQRGLKSMMIIFYDQVGIWIKSKFCNAKVDFEPLR